ncbi:MAG: hypothetical protein HY674_13385 [Chloroflexi bacterium]|nr:hypothetical protein [Chloroflexota bacterium]
MEMIDGNYSLPETESAIQAQEAAGRELTSLRAGTSAPPTNEADFKDLPAGEMPADFHLTSGVIPKGKKKVWSGSIYVKGKRQKAKGYRASN